MIVHFCAIVRTWSSSTLFWANRFFKYCFWGRCATRIQGLGATGTRCNWWPLDFVTIQLEYITLHCSIKGLLKLWISWAMIGFWFIWIRSAFGISIITSKSLLGCALRSSNDRKALRWICSYNKHLNKYRWILNLPWADIISMHCLYIFNLNMVWNIIIFNLK